MTRFEILSKSFPELDMRILEAFSHAICLFAKLWQMNKLCIAVLHNRR